jgi:hypothetical protein
VKEGKKREKDRIYPHDRQNMIDSRNAIVAQVWSYIEHKERKQAKKTTQTNRARLSSPSHYIPMCDKRSFTATASMSKQWQGDSTTSNSIMPLMKSASKDGNRRA